MESCWSILFVSYFEVCVYFLFLFLFGLLYLTNVSAFLHLCLILRQTEHNPTVFATHSTHKLLAALSQSSYIHVRYGRNAIEHEVFNESYMMHATTSPLYAIIASNDTATAMMDGPVGYGQ